MAKRKWAGTSSDVRNDIVLTPLKALLTHTICGLGLVLAFYAAHNLYSINLIENPAKTLYLIWVLESPVVVLLYSLLRHRRNQCSYLNAVIRGFLALPAGAVVNALGAMAVGAPVVHVSQQLLFGSSWADWHWIFAQTKPSKLIECMVCLPAHGAVIGAWFGAWPMPLTGKGRGRSGEFV